MIVNILFFCRISLLKSWLPQRQIVTCILL